MLSNLFCLISAIIAGIVAGVGGAGGLSVGSGFPLGVLMQLAIPESVSETCAQATQYWLSELNTTNILEIETWAVQMADSWGKLPEGILRGHVSAMGDFDECIEIQQILDLPGRAGHRLAGKYCTASLIPTPDFMNATLESEIGLPLVSKSSVSISELMNHVSHPFEGGMSLNPSLAVCFPSTCTQEDIQALITELLKISQLNEYVSPYVTTCSTKDGTGLGPGEIVMISLLSTLGLLLIAGTLVEYRIIRLNPQRGRSTVIKLLTSFSLISNTRALLSTSAERSNSLSCLHGIRFLTMCWVVLGHTWYSNNLSPVWNAIDARMLNSNGFPMAAIENFSVSVDTFFTIAGLLVAYNMLRALDKSKGSMNIPMLYLHRYIRLTPVVAVMVGFTATLWPHMGSGPNWFIVDIMAGFCRKSWWINLLYLNNLSEVAESGPFGKGNIQCLAHAWYVATDMQYYLLPPFLLYVVWKWKRIGISVLIFLTILSSLIPSLLTYLNGYLPSSIQRPGYRKYELDGYFRPWLRFGPYLIGIWTGYILHSLKNSPFKLKRKLLIPGWLIVTCTALAVIFAPYSYWNRNQPINNLGGLYAGLHRNAWAICIGWIIICCTKDHGGIVNLFLSWKPFLPLSRLTFSMYLVSWPLQMIFVLRLRQPIVYDAYSTVNIFFAHLVMSIFVGAICTLAIESPFIALEKIIFNRNSPPMNEMKVQPHPQPNSASNLLDVHNLKMSHL